MGNSNRELKFSPLKNRLFFAVWLKTQAFQKLNQKISKLKDFVLSKLNFSENLCSIDARDEFLCNKNQIDLGKNSTKRQNSRKLWHQNSRKQPKLKFSENPLTYFGRQTVKKKACTKAFHKSLILK